MHDVPRNVTINRRSDHDVRQFSYEHFTIRSDQVNTHPLLRLLVGS